MVKKLLIFFMLLSMAIPLWAGEKTVTISRNEGIYQNSSGVYYCYKDGITMTFSSGLNNVNYLVEHQQVVFDIFSTNYVIKKIKFNCLDNTTNDNLDCFYWGPSTIHECERSPYVRTGYYQSSGYIGTWTGGSTPSKYVKFETEGKPVRFGSVEITYEKELGDIFDLVTSMDQIEVGQKYVIVSQRASKAMSTQTVDGLQENNIPRTTMGSTSVSFVDDTKQKVIVNEDVMILSLESNPSTVSNTMRPYLFKYGNQYLRRNSATSGSDASASNYTYGHNLSLASYETATDKMYFPFNISLGTNSNAMMSFIQRGATQESESTSGSYAIRYHNGSDFFRVLNWSTTYNTYATNQRVYLYRPAQNYVITTQCLPNDNSGYITLGDGVLELNGQQTSQQYQNVSFFVGPTDGWGVGAVNVTNLSTNEVTTLTPTATSDFGNDYQFPMPDANVNITANFLQPFNIDTICDPANGGQFNFINGYTNFSGQYYSNEGKTVTFKPTAADGYIFNSVTITDNGVTTTMTPDANGVYSFVMPGNAVTLTANFEEAHDLYLLGTANGRTNWIPSGPKFTFDGTNNKYYIDVYFKGGNDDPNTDPAYGYFSLTKKIDEGGVWDNIAGFRLAAENNNTWVEDGYTGVHLYGDRPNNAFKIKPGVYRIEVNPEMTEMSIIEYPLTVTFTPASGTVVDAGDVVRFTSNLNDLVHGINSQEVQATFNSYDNWGVTTSDNTHTITHDGTTVTGQSKIGYITATGTADYEIVGDLYLLGTANGMNSWQPYGPKFTYDAATETYTLDVYFSGLNVTAADEGYGYFSLSSVISDPNNPNWNDIPNSARWNAQYDDFPIEGLAYNQSVNENLYQTNPNYAFKIDPGVYTITVNKGKTEMTVTKHELTLTFDPASGATVAAGDPVNIYSNLEQVVHAINPDEPLHATIQYATSTDGTLPTPNTQGSTVNITAEGATTTVNAQASLGYIVVPGNANYTVPAPTVYNITTQVNPAGSNAGTITAPSGSEAEQTVTFTVTNNNPAVYTLSAVEVSNSYGGLVDVTDNGDGTYSFTMPNDDVTIYADYVRTPYTVTTSWSPTDGGAIWLNGVNTPQTVSVANGDQVVFGVAPNTDYRLSSLTVMDLTTNTEITPVVSGSNEYTFTMPAANVSITAVFSNEYNITVVSDPTDVGTIRVYHDVNGSYQPYPVADVYTDQAGNTVQFTITPIEGYLVNSVTISKDGTDPTETVEYTTNVYGTYSFEMPAADVTVTVNYIEGYNIITDFFPGPECGHIEVVEHAAAGEVVQFTAGPSDGYSLSHVTVTGRFDDAPIEFSYENGIYSFTMPATDVRIKAYLVTGELLLTPVIVPDGAGYMTYNGPWYDDYNGTYHVHANQNIRIFQHANPGWEFDHLEITDPEGNIVISTRNADQLFTTRDYDFTVTAYYARQSHNITTVVTPEGAANISVDPRGHEGSTVNFTIEQNYTNYENWDLFSLTITTDGTNDTIPWTLDNGTYSFVMPTEDVTITAEYRRNYTLIIQSTPEDGGDAGVEGPSGVIWHVNEMMHGEIVTFKVITNPGFEIARITQYGTTVQITDNGDGTYTFEMPSNNLTITVYFQPTGDYQINVVNDPVEGGSTTLSGYVKVADGTYYSNEGMSVTITPRAAARWEVTGVDAVDSNNNPVDVTANANGTYTLIMPASDVTVTTHFIKSPFNIHTTVIGSGSIVLTGEAADKIEYAGQTVTFSLVPDDGNLLQSYSVYYYGSSENTIDVTDNGDGTYSFVMPEYSVVIKATFKPGYTVSTACFPAEGGTVVVTSGLTTGNVASSGALIHFTVNANESAGYDLKTIKVNRNGTGSSVSTVYELLDGSYEFYMPSDNVTIEAYFGKKHTVTTVCDPDDAGEIEFWYPGVVDGCAFAEDVVRFGVISYDGYVLESVTITNHTTNEVTELMSDYEVTDYTIFSFEMPDADVTITAHFAEGYKVTGIVDPEDGGGLGYYQELDNGYIIRGDYFIPGLTVITAIDIAPGYVMRSATVTLDDSGQEVTLIDDGGGMDWNECMAYYDKHFVMPAADVTITVIIDPYTPLRVIEHNNYEKANNGDAVTVSDDLVVVWAAKDCLWAKDLAVSNYSVPLPSEYVFDPENDNGNVDIRDYVKDDLGFQKHEWDQSNWVILDCSDLYSDITNVTERRKKLDDFVDHKIAGGTIKGIYQLPTRPDDLDPTHIWEFGKFNHVIKLTQEPEIRRESVVNNSGPSLGYPGYMQDPREENKAFDYHYNHYIPTTFFTYNRGGNIGQLYSFYPGPKAAQWASEEFDNLSIFILPPQDQEVAQVWAVYAGADTVEENGTTKLVDKFTVYEYYLDGYTSQNVYDLPGGFAVPAENWVYNRLNSGYTDESYGRPGKNDNEQTGSTKLMQDTAYLFHVAIKTVPFVTQLPEMRGPNQPAAFQKTDYYQIYPLDMDTHDGTVTGNRVIWEIDPASREVESVHYFNVMGQESKTPFDGINIVVTRYTDGSMSSKKIYR